MFIFVLFSVVVGNQIKAKDYLIQLNASQRSIIADLQVDERLPFIQYPQGAILKSTVTPPSSICTVEHDTMTLTANFTKQILQQDTEMYNPLNDQIIGVINQGSMIAFITEQHHYITLSLHTLEIDQNLSISSFVNAPQIFQQGIYSIEEQTTVLFYQNNTLLLNNNQITSVDVVIKGINDLQSSEGYVYIATDSGLKIYKIADQQFIYKNTIDSEQKIVDIALGGENGQILYLLENDGIHIYRINFDNNDIVVSQDPNIPYIRNEFGISFDVNNDESVVVLIKPQKHALFVDYEINLDKGAWFIVNQHYLKIDAKGIDINSKFAVIQGADIHNIVRHSLLSQLTTSLNLYAFQLSHTINLDFYEPDFELNSSVHNWYKNQSKNLLFGVDTYSLTLYNWEIINGQVVCHTDDPNMLGEKISVEINAILSECEQKDQFQDDVISKDLISCLFNHELILTITQNIDQYHQHVLKMMIFILSGALVLSVLIFVCYRAKTQKQLGKIKEEIKKYQKFGSEEQGVRQSTPHPGVDSNFKIDDDEQ